MYSPSLCTIEGYFWATCKIILFFNKIFLLLFNLALVLIFFIYGLFGVIHFILFRYSGLCWPREQRFGRVWRFWSQTGVHWCQSLVSVAGLDLFFCWLGNFSFSKIPVNLTQYCGTVGTFNGHHVIHKLEPKDLSLLNYSHSN